MLDIRQPRDATCIEPDASPSDAAFEEWYAAHHDRLRRWCQCRIGDRAAAEDISQEALARAWANRHRLATQADLARWVWHVARNLCIDHLRADGRVETHAEPPERPDSEADPVAHLLREDERRTVREALSALSSHHQKALYLHDVKQVGYDAMAQELGMSASGARALLCRARRSLRETLRTTQVPGVVVVPLLLGGRAFRTMARRMSGLGAVAVGAGSAAVLGALTLGVILAFPTQDEQVLRLPVPPPPETVAAVPDHADTDDIGASEASPAGMQAGEVASPVPVPASPARSEQARGVRELEIADDAVPMGGWNLSVYLGTAPGFGEAASAGPANVEPTALSARLPGEVNRAVDDLPCPALSVFERQADGQFRDERCPSGVSLSILPQAQR